MIGGSTISKREANKFCDHVPPTIISNYDHLPTLTNFTNTKVNHSKPVFAGRGGFPLFNHHLWWYRDVVMSFQITHSIRWKSGTSSIFCMVSMMWAPEFREKTTLRCFPLTTVICTFVDQWRRQKLRASHFMAGPSYHATHFSRLVVIHHQ
jgi:hypothetical protein